MAEKCVVGYKRASVEGSGYTYDEVFDKLEPCCLVFERWFNDTGNYKVTSFNHSKRSSHRLDNGFCFETRGSVLTLVLRAHTESNPRFCEIVPTDEINFCPFCGARVKIKCTKSVVLKRRTKEVFDGYDEEVVWADNGSLPPNDETTKHFSLPATVKAELTHEQEMRLDYSNTPDPRKMQETRDRINRLSSRSK